jgi:hypothetical protein
MRGENMKSSWTVIGTAGLVALSILCASATATAHTSDIAVSCPDGRTTFTVHLTNYAGESNSLLITGDDATLAATHFAAEFRLERAFDGAIDHTFTVMLKAGDDPSGMHGWSFVRKIDAPRCTAAPPAQPVPQTTPVRPKNPVPPPAPITTSTIPTIASATKSSTPTTVTSSAEVVSVLTGREEPMPSTGASPVWMLLTCFLLLGTGVTILFASRRQKVQGRKSG